MKNAYLFVLLFYITGFPETGFCQTDYSQMTAEVDAAMTKFVSEKKISGAVTLAIHNGKIIHLSSTGMSDIEEGKEMNSDSLFRIASLSKNFTAAAFMTLQDAGKVSIYDKVEKYIPEFKGLKLKSDDGKGDVDIRIWHLMSHTSGIKLLKASTMPSLKDAAASVRKAPLDFRPGSQWKYSRGLDAVAHIIEVASGMPFTAYMAKTITTPLGLKDTGFSLDNEQVKRLVTSYAKGANKTLVVAKELESWKKRTVLPSGGLLSTASDVGTFYAMLLNKGVHNGKRILSEEAVTQLTTSRTGKLNTVPGCAWGLGYCLVEHPQGFSVSLNARSFGHWGGIGPHAWADPATKTVYVLMIQRRGFGEPRNSDINRKFQEIISKGIQ